MSATKAMPLGKVMLGLAGLELTAAEKEMLLHPLVAGVILFSRNFADVAQLKALTSSIKNLRTPELLIGVDHEGGRVQRFRKGFSDLEPMGKLGELYETSLELSGTPTPALDKAREVGKTLAGELKRVGVGFSFTPVLDLDYGWSKVIGDRAFSGNPEVVAQLAQALHQGLLSEKMAGVAKHFPGHGYVSFDTHLEIAVDTRSFSAIEQQDLIPFKSLIQSGVAAIMPAHVRYSALDEMPAGFSKFWLQDILRQKLGFTGVIVSDDLGMEAAAVYGSLLERAELAIDAGCDLVLLCNDLDDFAEVLDGWKTACFDLAAQDRLLQLS